MLETQKALQRFAKHVVRQAKANLKKNGTGALKNSIKHDLKVHKNSFSLDFEMEKYGMFQDKGVRGANPNLVKNGKQKAPFSPFSYRSKMPPMQSILKWVKFKGIRFRDKQGRFKSGSYKTIAFILQRRIFAQGLKPSLFFTKPFAKAFENLPNEFAEAYGMDVEKLIGFTLKNIDTNKEEGPSQFSSTQHIPDKLDSDMIKFFGIKP